MTKSELYNYYRERSKQNLIKTGSAEISGKVLGLVDYLYNNFGIVLLVYRTQASYEEQWELRKKYLSGGNRAARPGESWHNFGRGFDVVEIGDNGQALWQNPNWNIITNAFLNAGFKSGASYGDTNHFEYTKGTTLAHERAKKPGYQKYWEMEKLITGGKDFPETTAPGLPQYVKPRIPKWVFPTAIGATALGIILISYENRKSRSY